MSAFIQRDPHFPKLDPNGHSRRDWHRDTFTFATRLKFVLKAWVQHPRQVATVMPSSNYLIGRITERECVRNAHHVIELGPGAGGTTVGLLAQMRPDAKLLAIEKTGLFEEALSQIDDSRLVVQIADALQISNLMADEQMGNADVVVSGIPFSSIPPTTAVRIIESIHESLRPGGTFIAYQLHNDVEKLASPIFGSASTERVPWNLPPLRLYTWEKNGIG